MTSYRSQRVNYQYTVCKSGKSADSCRHPHPVRTTPDNQKKLDNPDDWRPL